MPVFITPRGRDPAIRRADRGRSRHPVASTTAWAASVRRPAGPVSCSSPSVEKPVTIVWGSIVAPASSAART